MKKILFYGFALCLSVMSLTSCSNDEQHTDTRVTNYINLTINGDEVVYVAANSVYTDAGCKAEAAGQDVSDKIQTTNPVNTSEIGPYVVTYKAVNEDGFASEVNRYVYVGDPLMGSVMTGSFRQTKAGAVVNWSGFDIDMLTDGNGLYWVEDLLGGYYEQRAGYGDRYSMKGFLKVNADNSVDMVGGGDVVGWQDSYDDFKNGKFDPATNTISYTVVYAAMDFNVILSLN
jgi:hypothetical protein